MSGSLIVIHYPGAMGRDSQSMEGLNGVYTPHP